MTQDRIITSDIPQPRDAWDTLSMKEKAEMIGVAVRNGITNLQDIREKYNEFAEGGSKEDEEVVNTDEQYLRTMERVAEDNHQKWGFNNPDEALLHALNDNTYNYRGYYGKYPQSKANADTHWTDEFKTVWHPTFSNESIYSGQKSQYNPIGLPGGFWSGDTFIPMAWQIDANEYKKGGGIHIKQSHRGRLTELKERTGKTEAELYRTGGPAVRKMITFARNARKWKHGLGGNLFAPGGYVRSTNDHPVAFDEEGNLVDQVTGETGTMKIPEIVVTGRDYTKPYISSYDGEAILPFIQLFDPTGISNIPVLAKDLHNDSTDWRRVALDAVSILPYFRHGKAARNALRHMGKLGQTLSWIPTTLSNGEKKGLELLNKGYNKIAKKSTDFVEDARKYFDYPKFAARLSPAETTGRWQMDFPMHYSGGQPQGVHQGPVHTLLGDNTYYTGFFKANSETDIAGDYSVKNKDALNQFFYGKGNLTPYKGKPITLNGRSWDIPHFSENILPINKGDTLELSTKQMPLIEQKIKDKGFIGLNSNSLQRISPDREGTVMLNGRSFNVKPFKDDKGQVYLKAFDKFDFSGTVPFGSFPDNYVESTKFLYPNSGPFAIVQDSIPVSFKDKGKDANMFDDMMKDYDNVMLWGLVRKK